MTTPEERTRAPRQAGDLLRDLKAHPDIPPDIRCRMAGVRRHYPEEWQLHLMA
jgi:hypothetical protein